MKIEKKANWYWLIPIVICSILFFIIPKHPEPNITLQEFYSGNPQYLFYDIVLWISVGIWIISMVLLVGSVGITKNYKT